MAEDRRRHEVDRPSGVDQPFAQIGVLEPGRRKLLVEAFDLFERTAAHHEAARHCSLDRSGDGFVEIGQFSTPRDGIARPQPLDQQQLHRKAPHRRQAPGVEVALRLFGHREEAAGDGAALRVLVEKRRQALDGARRGFGVGIEQQQVSAGGFRRGAIHARGVARRSWEAESGSRRESARR